MARDERLEIIKGKFDLGNHRLSSEKKDRLCEIINNTGDYVGKKAFEHNVSVGTYSGGRYVRTENTSYQICEDDQGLFINKKYSQHDDDGEDGFDSDKDIRDVCEFLDAVISNVWK